MRDGCERRRKKNDENERTNECCARKWGVVLRWLSGVSVEWMSDGHRSVRCRRRLPITIGWLTDSCCCCVAASRDWSAGLIEGEHNRHKQTFYWQVRVAERSEKKCIACAVCVWLFPSSLSVLVICGGGEKVGGKWMKLEEEVGEAAGALIRCHGNWKAKKKHKQTKMWKKIKGKGNFPVAVVAVTSMMMMMSSWFMCVHMSITKTNNCK